ncbi:AI-2E family transporter [Hansschlegelia beijingensis]|uniref:Putative PurR-regulated permease PerM n=1 Tax=Hansschlegelia beijingensis TaxID=1133344 RepID=A0A7W6GG40_9HYPH|nr:AI-2E family transporter [Hansschlegelia beijingensis]MBB3972304.1 putative PurR-regulated permease PerM [Hansschlegelia beijingensis]
MSLQRQALFWLAALVAVAFFLYLFSGILLPFVAGLALAYLLDPLADRLERLGLPRVAATVVILLSVLLVFVAAIILIAPLIGQQILGLVQRMPETIARLQELLATQRQGWFGGVVNQGLGQLRDSLGTVVSQAVNWITAFLSSLWASGDAIMSVVSLLVVTPVVAFYMLIDWDRMVGTIDAWTPLRHKETVRSLAREMDESIAGFVRGQALVCLLLGTFYGIALSTVGLNFGLVIGLAAGLIGFIPYVGSLTGLIVSVGVATVQFWPDWTMILLVFGIFVIGQFVEGNILQPRLVGASVGLHPVWLMFALVAFGYLFGFVGLLVAVPLAASLAVLMRFAIRRYLESPFYTGAQGPSMLPGGPKGASLFGPRGLPPQDPRPIAGPPEQS